MDVGSSLDKRYTSASLYLLFLVAFFVVRSCSGFFQVRVRRHKLARGRDDVIDLEKKLRSGLGFGCCFFLSSVEDLGLSGYGQVVGRYTCVLHDVERSLHIYDIDLVS